MVEDKMPEKESFPAETMTGLSAASSVRFFSPVAKQIEPKTDLKESLIVASAEEEHSNVAP